VNHHARANQRFETVGVTVTVVRSRIYRTDYIFTIPIRCTDRSTFVASFFNFTVPPSDRLAVGSSPCLANRRSTSAQRTARRNENQQRTPIILALIFSPPIRAHHPLIRRMNYFGSACLARSGRALVLKPAQERLAYGRSVRHRSASSAALVPLAPEFPSLP